jgi:virginiamycin B lyase
MWFTESSGSPGGSKIGRMTTAGVVTNEYPTTTSGSSPVAIVSGPDGALWFVESDAGNVGRITTGGTMTEYPIPTAESVPTAIAVGPDGALWFTECMGNKIGRLSW